MAYTLGQAAKATGKSKTTVLRAIQKGKISAGRDAHGQWSIEPAELHRVYPAVDHGNSARNTSEGNIELHHRINLLEVQLEAERQQNCTASEVIADLRRDRDKWRDQAAGLLTDQRPTAGKPPGRLTWRERLTGKASASPSGDSVGESRACEDDRPAEQAAWGKP